jgi:hypothetical protein
LSWYWIGLALGIPTLAGFLIALPFWFARATMMGNIVGSGVMLFGALLSIGREYVALKALRLEHFEAGKMFRASPDDFTRYAIYAGIGFAEVFLLFMVSIWVEEALRRRRGGRARPASL